MWRAKADFCLGPHKKATRPQVKQNKVSAAPKKSFMNPLFKFTAPRKRRDSLVKEGALSEFWPPLSGGRGGSLRR